MPLSLAVALVLVALLAVLVALWWYARRRPLLFDASADACAVCGEIELVALAPGAYQCPTCGDEGGPGWAAYHRRRDGVPSSDQP
ncbi:MAG TPA: hypothetical protein VFG69_06965, partial [Nannocystaceae bacterium]|nr:hypothetical protein [Nannocystaceae bacterium]